MTKWVSVIMSANIAVFFLQQVQPELAGLFALVPALAWLRPWTPFTYMFIHGSLGHIFFNMLSLYYFGPRLELLLGGRRFLTLYFLSGLGGALLSFLPQYYLSPIIGASGAIFGVSTAYARVWPDDPRFIVRPRVFVGIMIVVSILGGLGLMQQGIAHFAHLGGIAVGWFYMGYLVRNSGAKKFAERAVPVAPVISESAAMARWATIPVAQLHELNRDEVNRLLEKARTGGARSLSIDERATLDRFSRA